MVGVDVNKPQLFRKRHLLQPPGLSLRTVSTVGCTPGEDARHTALIVAPAYGWRLVGWYGKPGLAKPILSKNNIRGCLPGYL